MNAIDALPPIEDPAAYRDVLRALSQDTFAVEEIGRRVAVMPVVAAHVLRVANGPEFGGGMPIDRLDRAIILLGQRPIRDLVERLMAVPRQDFAVADATASDLVRHLVVTAKAAGLVANAARLPLGHLAYTAGLLHDLGFVLQLQAHGSSFVFAYESSVTTGVRLIEHERLLCHTDHCEQVEELFGAWDLPLTVVTPIGYHHDPLSAPAAHRYLATILYVAECLMRHAGFEDLCGEAVPALEEKALAELRLGHESLDAHAEHLRQTVNTLVASDGSSQVPIHIGDTR